MQGRVNCLLGLDIFICLFLWESRVYSSKPNLGKSSTVFYQPPQVSVHVYTLPIQLSDTDLNLDKGSYRSISVLDLDVHIHFFFSQRNPKSLVQSLFFAKSSIVYFTLHRRFQLTYTMLSATKLPGP